MIFAEFLMISTHIAEDALLLEENVRRIAYIVPSCFPHTAYTMHYSVYSV